MKFKLFRTKIEISYLLLCLAAAAVILDVFQGFLFCVMAVVIHESGHLREYFNYFFFFFVEFYLFSVSFSVILVRGGADRAFRCGKSFGRAV